ncbi:hypothetical protein CASFOL_004654 [Castilleja foliolosa]|uniref:Carboxypeptidase n=1 Tax=Castilleja foliolosa TaxID=1961234 RepID=A0ABD3ED41_9LAMI
MENKPALVFFSTLILSCFIAQSSAFLGFKKDYKLMSNTYKSLFNASKLVIDEKKLVYSQEGLKKKDKIKSLPGQPEGIKFNQYGGYVTVDQKAGRALYYYFVEAQNYAQASPLVLWLNGGPGCSSLAYGAMQELGPFRVMSDGKTLFENKYAWNKAANVLFLESPAGVGFSYSKKMTDNTSGGDKKTAKDNYVFLVNWLERFPEYKNRDFYIAGESYAGYYVPELAHIILNQNKKANMLPVKLNGIIIGNAVLNDETDNIGMWKYWASHALITDNLANQGIKDCANSTTTGTSDKCNRAWDEGYKEFGNIDIYNIYAPICLSNLTDTTPKITSIFNPDPCSDIYVYAYMNRADVQKALHANVTNDIPYDWESCSDVLQNWTDGAVTNLPLLKEFMNHGLRVWVFSGDVDGRVPVTSTQLSIKAMKLGIHSQWRPWYLKNEVGGYTQEYKDKQECKGKLTFVTVRGAGHQVPTYQPKRALALILHFLNGTKLPSS